MPKLKRRRPHPSTDERPPKAQKTSKMAGTSGGSVAETSTVARTDTQVGTASADFCEALSIDRYVQTCLLSWFQNSSASDGRRKTCPDCRLVVSREPSPVYIIRELTAKLIPHLPFLDENGSLDQIEKERSEETALIESHRSNSDPECGGLFCGIFKHPEELELALLQDEEDGVLRCPRCAWEMEEPYHACMHCGLWMQESETEEDSPEHYSTHDFESGSEFEAPLEDRDAAPHMFPHPLDYGLPALSYNNQEDLLNDRAYHQAIGEDLLENEASEGTASPVRSNVIEQHQPRVVIPRPNPRELPPRTDWNLSELDEGEDEDDEDEDEGSLQDFIVDDDEGEANEEEDDTSAESSHGYSERDQGARRAWTVSSASSATGSDDSDSAFVRPSQTGINRHRLPQAHTARNQQPMHNLVSSTDENDTGDDEPPIRSVWGMRGRRDIPTIVKDDEDDG
ncbi:MAG: hypothetical protein Q9162_007392 [Coniocarpon cinnabarinum]